jgi:exopolysaccharide production protein ExoY
LRSALYAFDRLLAAILLLLAVPVICLTAIIILCLSSRTPLVAHLRVGRRGRPFWMLKFRTMWGPGTTYAPGRFIEQVANGDPESKEAGDARVSSWFARLCRKFSVDELPQLAHVVAGQMSLVGPRPITHAELVKHYGSSAEQVTEILPGMTGLWQVMGRNRLSYPSRRRLDVFLVRHFSTRLYFLILLRTIPSVLFGRNAW